MSRNNQKFDYIVVGAGAAGCVVASRLSENAANNVLLLEEGPHDRSLFIRANGGFFKTHGTKRTFLFHTEPEPGANGRRFPLMQGRTLGGGTSVNAMCYIRGQREDYDGWEADGSKGWSYDDVLPYFRKSENNGHFGGRYHGTEGPLRVSDGVHRHVLSEAFVRAAQETRLPDRNSLAVYNPDFNGAWQEGVGFYQLMSYRGERFSTSRSFLEGAKHRSNLTVRTDAPVKRILIEERRAVGIVLSQPGGREEIIRAEREVILCAGTFMSPKLLMLSGIGPAEELKDHGIPVIVHSPKVGANYQDHFLVPVDVTLKNPISFIGQDRGIRAVVNGIQWLLFKTGPLASNVSESGGFFDLDGDGRPEIQLNALPVSSAGWGDKPPAEHRFSLAPLCLTCNSRGSVKLRSANPLDPPKVHGNFLHDTEVQNLTNGIMMSRRIIASAPLSRYLSTEVYPGPQVNDDRKEIAQYVKAMAKTALHPIGTCAIGPATDDVLDLELRVRGVQGLRVVDGSVMPKIIRGNTTAPIIMIAERAAELISMSQSAKRVT